MEEKQMDNILKSIAREEELIIPKEINERVSSTMKKLPRHRRFSIRGIAIAADLLFTVFGVFPTLSPSYAQDIPLLKSVFSYFSKSDDYYTKQYFKYSAKVNLSQIDNNYTVTVNEVVVDDNFLVMGYTVKGDKKFSEEFISSPYLFGNVSADGRNLMNPSTRAEMIDESSFAGYLSYFVGREQLPNQFRLDFSVTEIDNTKGNWNFSLDISKTVTQDDTQIIKPNVKASLPYGQLKIPKIAMSPLGNSILIDFIKFESDAMIYNYFVLDDQGKSLYVTGRTAHRNLLEVFFIKGEAKPRELTLIPYRFSPNYDTKPVEFLTDSVKHLPIVFTPRSETKVIVEEVVYSGSKAKVYYKIDGVYPYSYAVKLVLFDNEGNQLFPISNTEQLIDPETNQFVVEFNDLDNNKKYKVATPKLNDLEVLTEMKITIPLN